ncbi:hypothetical protein CRG98_037948 [Punica granatum]|uniref:F-box domain-containing protein n=1 Tax=Punica granatum TaxID=22663 RepID=A0A2I0ICC5_PUNGR|nr:hypothetical protein CRG98_037948 [Punica granatum]
MADLLSSLPDELIYHIFSFVPIKELVRTCVLSKRWQHIWASTPYLNFENIRYNNEVSASFINRFLSLYSSETIEKFSLRNITWFKRDDFKMDESATYMPWLQFAVDCGVKDLSVCACECQLPLLVHSCSSIVKLELYSLIIGPIGSISWPLLKSLTINCPVSWLSDDDIRKILIGSPKLEFLKLRSCKFINDIEVKSSSVRELVIDGFTSAKDCMHPPLEIYTPKLRVLRILGHVLMDVRLTNVSSVVEAEINFCHAENTTMTSEGGGGGGGGD